MRANQDSSLEEFEAVYWRTLALLESREQSVDFEKLRIRQLALNWLAQAEEDQRAASRIGHAEAVRQSLHDWAMARANCAVELMRVLQEQEKENPLNGGPCSPHDADRESA